MSKEKETTYGMLEKMRNEQDKALAELGEKEFIKSLSPTETKQIPESTLKDKEVRDNFRKFAEEKLQLTLSTQEIDLVTDHFLTEITKARESERKRIAEEVLDIIEETDWIEEPKSAFARLNILLRFLLSSINEKE